jgi:perosamine synthetase
MSPDTNGLDPHDETLPPIPIAGPWITDLEVNYVAEATRSAWYENSRDFILRFENSFAQAMGRRYALALPSCTSGIHLALAALNIGPGDEVIVPESTWIATAAPITYVGGSVVFADVDPDTWCIDVERLPSYITPRTRAIIAVDLYGGMPEMKRLQDLAAQHGIALIEDAAEAIGSRRDGGPAGSFGLASVFSFHGTKTLTTGEGGMIVTDDTDLMERMQYLGDHARQPGDTSFFQNEVAYKYKMSSLQAALGLAQLERLTELVEKKREIFSYYREALKGVDYLTLNSEPDDSYNSYWMVTVLLDRQLDLPIQTFRTELERLGINTRPFFHPLSSLPAFKDQPHAVHAQKLNAVAYDLASRGLNLPSALRLGEEEVARVAAAVRQVIGVQTQRRPQEVTT